VIDALVAGKLIGTAVERTASSGKQFVTAKVRAASGDGDALFINVIAFDDNAKTVLVTLADGDSVALAGSLTPKVWTDKQGESRPALDMTAHAVLTPYDVKRKRVAAPRTSGPKVEASRTFARGTRNGPRGVRVSVDDSNATAIEDDDVDF